MLHPFRQTLFNFNPESTTKKSIEDYCIPGISQCRSWTGRSCLQLLINRLNLNKSSIVLLPCYVPEGVISPFKRNKINILFYKLNEDLSVNLENLQQIFKENEKINLFIQINFFGFINSNNTVFEFIRNKKTLILEDHAHSIFSHNSQNTIDPDFILYSFNKFLPVTDGALLVSLNENYNLNSINDCVSSENTVACAFYKEHLLLNYNLFQENNVKYAPEIIKNTGNKYEKYYEIINNDLSLREISKESKNLINKINVNSLIKIRKINTEIIYSKLKNPFLKLVFNEYNSSFVPFCIPIIVLDDKKNDLIKYAINNNIFLATLVDKWNYIPNDKEYNFVNEKFFLLNHVLLPINEFISSDKILNMLDVLNKFEG